MKKLNALFILILLSTMAYGQSWTNVSNSLQRKIVGADTLYRFNMGAPGFWNISDAINAATASGVTSFNSRTGAVIPLLADYSGLFSATSPILYNSSTGVISSQAASTTLSGHLTAAGQTIGGVKSFTATHTIFDGSLNMLPANGSFSTGYGGIHLGTTNLFTFKRADISSLANFDFGGLTLTRTYTFPNANGTVALTSDIPASLPTPNALTAGYGLSGSSFDGNTARTWTADTTSATGLVSKGRLNTALASKVTANASITGATKAKITYDSKGLVTAGADLTESDIPSLSISKVTGLQDSLTNKFSKPDANKRYMPYDWTTVPQHRNIGKSISKKDTIVESGGGNYLHIQQRDTIRMSATDNYYGSVDDIVAYRDSANGTGTSWAKLIYSRVGSLNTKDWGEGAADHSSLIGVGSVVATNTGALGGILSASSFTAFMNHNGSNTVTNRYGLLVVDASVAGTATLTNQYAIYSPLLDAATNNYFLYSLGGRNKLFGTMELPNLTNGTAGTDSLIVAGSNDELRRISPTYYAPLNSPSLITPNIGAATGTSLNTTGALTSNTGVSLTQASSPRGGFYTYNVLTGAGTDYSIGMFSEDEYWIATNGSVIKRFRINSTSAIFSVGVTVPLETYGASWAAKPEAATKQDIYAKIEAGARQLEEWHIDAGNVGSSLTDLYSFSVPANTLTTDGDKLDFVFSGSYASNANNKSFRLLIGTNGITYPGVTTNGGNWSMTGTMIRTGASTFRITVRKTGFTEETNDITVDNTGTFSGAVQFKLQATCVADNDIIAQLGSVTYTPAP